VLLIAEYERVVADVVSRAAERRSSVPAYGSIGLPLMTATDCS
jgi:hypothetical protein